MWTSFTAAPRVRRADHRARARWRDRARRSASPCDLFPVAVCADMTAGTAILGLRAVRRGRQHSHAAEARLEARRYDVRPGQLPADPRGRHRGVASCARTWRAVRLCASAGRHGGRRSEARQRRRAGGAGPQHAVRHVPRARSGATRPTIRRTASPREPELRRSTSPRRHHDHLQRGERRSPSINQRRLHLRRLHGRLRRRAVHQPGDGRPQRRVVSDPDRRLHEPGHRASGTLPVKAFGCFFLLQPVEHSGQRQLDLRRSSSTSAQASGSRARGPGAGPYKIVLHNDPDSDDS